MENYVIIGPPRSGKSTLASMIVKNVKNYSMISCDNFKSAYTGLIFDKRIKSGSLNYDLPVMMCAYYFEESIRYENDLNYVIDISDLCMDAIEVFKKHNAKFIFLVYPKLTEKELFKRIREHDTSRDWTSKENDFMLMLYCNCFIKTSKKMEKYAKEHNEILIDVSYDRDKVIEDTFKKLFNN